jgi:hypothetical protein
VVFQNGRLSLYQREELPTPLTKGTKRLSDILFPSPGGRGINGRGITPTHPRSRYKDSGIFDKGKGIMKVLSQSLLGF